MKKTIKKPDKIPENPTPEELGAMTKEERLKFLNNPNWPPISSGDDELDRTFSSALKKRFRKN